MGKDSRKRPRRQLRDKGDFVLRWPRGDAVALPAQSPTHHLALTVDSREASLALDAVLFFVAEHLHERLNAG
jgi:hypothetical protein